MKKVRKLYDMNNRILVTGSRGFIGRHLCDVLSKSGHTVIEFDYTSTSWDDELYIRELNEISETQPIEMVVHLGAMATTHGVDRKTLFGFNTEAVRAVGQLCKERQIPLIFTSSSAVYGNQGQNLSLYAWSKRQAEIEIEKIAGLNFMIFRLFNTYGYDETKKGEMKSVVSDMIISALRFKTVKIVELDSVPFGYQARDFVSVKDVCRIIQEFIFNLKIENKILDLGTGNSYSFIQIANAIGHCLPGIKVEKMKLPQGYNPVNYQVHTKARMEWLENSTLFNLPSAPWLNIPTLIREYAAELSV